MPNKLHSFFLFACLLLVSSFGFGQAASALYPLTSDGSPVVTGNVTATDIDWGNQNTPSPTANGASSSGWPTASTINANYYYEFSFTPTAGSTLTFTGVSFQYGTSSGTWAGAAYYSTNGFTSSTQIGSNFTPGTTAQTFTNAAQSVSVPFGTTLKVRVYAWDASGSNRAFRVKNMTLNGTTCSIPAIATQPTGQTLCAGAAISLSATVTGATSYQWKKDGSNISGATSATYSKSNATAADSGSYTVVATNACGSTLSSVAVVVVNPVPTLVVATASETSVCAGTSVNLSASATSNSAPGPITLFSENFNGATNSFTTFNNTTGGTSNSAAAWTLRPEGYQWSTSTTVTFSSNDNSQFYLTNSDAAGNGNTTSTILQSPSFSTVGLTAANLTFYHYFRRYQTGEVCRVEISTNGGSNWAALQTYTTAQGSSTSFQNVSLSLASYLNQPNVMIRFKYDAPYGYYWAIDNVAVSGTGVVATTYAWTSSPAGFTSSLQNPTVTPTQTTTYTVTVSNGYGCTASASTSLVTVNPASIGGTVSGSTTVCAASNSGSLTLGGNVGSVIGWESSLNNFATAGTPIANTTTTLNYSGLAQTTYYRAIVKSGSCASANSSIATVTVNAASVGGTVSGSTTVCAASNSGSLTLGGNVGSVIGWESSLNNFATAGTPIANTTTTLNYSGLAQTTYYRAIVKSGSCASANSSIATVTVNPASVGGTVSGSTTVCAASNSGSLTLGGNAGSVIGWESSLNNFATAGTPIANTTTTLNYSGLAQTTYYRAIVKSGSCASANSAIATVTVNPASVGGTVSGSTTVCAASNSGSLTLGGNVGSVIGWESSLNNFATAGTPIANTTTTLNYSGLAQTTYYRAIVKSGSCASANSSIATVTVNPASVGGTVSGSTTVCATSNSGSLTLGGNVGSVIGWESSLNNFATAGTPIANTTTTLNYSGLAQTTYYRAIVKSGLCSQATSSIATVTVAPAVVAGVLNGGATYCSETNSGTLTLTGYTGSTFSWEYSTDNFATAGIPVLNNAATLNYSNISATAYYRVAVGNGVCGQQYSNVVSIVIDSHSTWTGANGTNWHDAGNWSCAEVPQPYTIVTIPSVANQPEISGDATAFSIAMNAGTTLKVTSGHDLTVTDAIVSNGTLTLENNANLIQINNVANSGTSVVKRNSSALIRQDYTLWSSPVSGQQLLAFSPQTLTNRFYTYNTASNLYSAVSAPASTNFNAGTGYLIRMPNNHPTTPTVWNGTFAGTLHNGTTSVALNNVGAGQRFNAIGNPYPSPIDLQSFVADNASNITGAIYFWRKTNNSASPSYCSWTLGGGFVTDNEAQATDPQDVIRTAQGFIVEASASGSQVVFNNAQRSGNNSNQFFRSANAIERNRIWLNATSASGAFCQTLVGYITGSTMGEDAGIDAKFFNDGDMSFYSLVSGERFVIQGRPLPFVDTDVVPMGFKAAVAGNYTIAIDHVDGLFGEGQTVYLRDNLTGMVHNLTSGAYSFASEAGTFNERFEVLYQNSLGNHTPAFGDESVVVYKQNGSFVVNSGNATMASVKVYDVVGKLVKQLDDINASEVSFAVAGANQVLLFKITSTENREAVKKVIN